MPDPGLRGGTLACATGCEGFDTSGCRECGNDRQEDPELCDGSDLNGVDCASQGYDGGDLICVDSCDGYDTSGCWECGDDVRAGPELCDGSDLDGEDCVSRGLEGGTLDCRAGCDGFDTSGCWGCGNDERENSEVCDGSDLVGEDCVSQGFDYGSLRCAGDCAGFVTAGCFDCPRAELGSELGMVASGSTSGAPDYLSPSCDTSSASDIQWGWSAPAAGTFFFTTFGSDFDTVLYLLETDCSGLELGCNDDSVAEQTSAGTSEVTVELAASERVIVVVDGYDADDGDFELNISPVICPDSDLGSAVGPAVATGDTSDEIDEMTPPCDVNVAGPDVQLAWNAPAAGTFVSDTIGSSYDTALFVRESCGGPVLACDDDGGGGWLSQVTLTLALGQSVIVVVDGWRHSSAGAYVLNITQQ